MSFKLQLERFEKILTNSKFDLDARTSQWDTLCQLIKETTSDEREIFYQLTILFAKIQPSLDKLDYLYDMLESLINKQKLQPLADIHKFEFAKKYEMLGDRKKSLNLYRKLYFFPDLQNTTDIISQLELAFNRLEEATYNSYLVAQHECLIQKLKNSYEIEKNQIETMIYSSKRIYISNQKSVNAELLQKLREELDECLEKLENYAKRFFLIKAYDESIKIYEQLIKFEPENKTKYSLRHLELINIKETILPQSVINFNYRNSEWRKNFQSYRTMFQSSCKDMRILLNEQGLNDLVFEDIAKNFTQQQEKYNHNVITLTKEVIKHCVNQIGNPPTDFVILGTGSVNQRNLTITSDLDFAILVADKELKKSEYFYVLISLIDLYLKLIDGFYVFDSNSYSNIVCEDPIHIDDIDSYINKYDFSNDSNLCMEESYSLQTSGLLYSRNESSNELYNQFVARKKNTWNNSSTRALKLFDYHKPKKGNDNVKDKYLKPLQYWCLDLALFYNLWHTGEEWNFSIQSCLHILQAKAKLNPKMAHIISRAYIQLQIINIIDPTICLASTKCRLDNIEYNIIYPLYKQLVNYIDIKDEKKITFVSQIVERLNQNIFSDSYYINWLCFGGEANLHLLARKYNPNCEMLRWIEKSNTRPFLIEQLNTHLSSQLINVNNLLKLIVHGKREEAEELAKLDPSMVFIKGDVTDHANRNFKKISCIQYAAWAYDTQTLKMLIKHIPFDKFNTVLQQLNELELQGTNFGTHYDFTIISALEAHINLIKNIKHSDRNGHSFEDMFFQDPECYDHWHEIVGKAQYLSPIHFFYAHFHPDRMLHYPSNDIQYQNTKKSIITNSFSTLSQEPSRGQNTIYVALRVKSFFDLNIPKLSSAFQQLELCALDLYSMMNFRKAKVEELAECIQQLRDHLGSGIFTNSHIIPTGLNAASGENFSIEEFPENLVHKKNNFPNSTIVVPSITAIRELDVIAAQLKQADINEIQFDIADVQHLMPKKYVPGKPSQVTNNLIFNQNRSYFNGRLIGEIIEEVRLNNFNQVLCSYYSSLEHADQAAFLDFYNIYNILSGKPLIKVKYKEFNIAAINEMSEFYRKHSKYFEDIYSISNNTTLNHLIKKLKNSEFTNHELEESHSITRYIFENYFLAHIQAADEKEAVLCCLLKYNYKGGYCFAIHTFISEIFEHVNYVMGTHNAINHKCLELSTFEYLPIAQGIVIKEVTPVIECDYQGIYCDVVFDMKLREAGANFIEFETRHTITFNFGAAIQYKLAVQSATARVYHCDSWNEISRNINQSDRINSAHPILVTYVQKYLANGHDAELVEVIKMYYPELVEIKPSKILNVRSTFFNRYVFPAAVPNEHDDLLIIFGKIERALQKRGEIKQTLAEKMFENIEKYLGDVKKFIYAIQALVCMGESKKVHDILKPYNNGRYSEQAVLTNVALTAIYPEIKKGVEEVPLAWVNRL
jgi:hypothetical protein